MNHPFNLQDELVLIQDNNLYRHRQVLDSPQGIEIESAGKHYLNFSSNDYLGLANHPDLIAGFRTAVDRYGVGSGAAHLVCGHSAAHHALEEELADWLGRERALLFSTGYMANLGVISALLGKTDAVFEDRLNHASLLDGGLLSGARFQRFQHADSNDLQRRLEKSSAQRKLIVTDGVFSMDGDLAPLQTLATCAHDTNAWLMVDDAHGIGVLGANGQGSLQVAGLNQSQVPVLMGTLGKALGTFGAFVAGSEDLIEFLIQRARTYIYTTAMPAAVAEATRASLQLVQSDDWRRQKLVNLVKRFQHGLIQLGIQPVATTTPIQPILLGDSQRAIQVSDGLKQRGFWVTAIRPPTVATGTARLRVTLCASHQEVHVDRLLDALDQSMKESQSSFNHIDR
ncbi:MAG: 8-amino-7-oxononanoate synthase [Methylococcales bacterium]